jgi:hypothetical protein
VTGQFWLGVLVGAVTTFGLIVVWGLARIAKQRQPLCMWCGGRKDEPVVIKGDTCPSPFHQGQPGWDF